MARTYGKLYLSIWSDPDFLQLSAAAQRLYMMLLANPKVSSAGVLPLQIARWSKTARDTTREGTERAFRELIERGYLVADEATEEVWIRSFIRHDKGYMNKNLGKGLASAVRNGIESVDIYNLAHDELTKCLQEGPSNAVVEAVTEALGNALPTPFRTTTTTPTETAAAAGGSGSQLIDVAIGMLLDEKVQRRNPDDPAAYRRRLEDDVPDEVRPIMLARLRANPDADVNELVAVGLGETTPATPRDLTYAGESFGRSIALGHIADGRECDESQIREEALWSNSDATYVDAAVRAYLEAFTATNVVPIRGSA